MVTRVGSAGGGSRDEQPPTEHTPEPLPLERQLAVQFEIARAFAEAEDLDDVAGFTLRTLADAFDWRAAALWRPDSDGLMACVATHAASDQLAAWTSETCSRRFAPGEGLPGRAWESGKPIWIRDTDSEENFPRRPIAVAAGLRHGLAFPIRVRGKVDAVIELFAADVRDVDDEQIKFYRAVGHQLGSFIGRIEARREVALSEARKTGVLSAAVDAIVTANADGRIVEFNPAAEQLFGRRRVDVLGHTIAEMLVPEEIRATHEAGLAHYVATGEARIIGQRVRTQALRADGSRVPVELTVTEIRIDRQPMFTAFIRDVTRERQAETARERFLEILSHELRTPVTAIYGGAKLMDRTTLDAEQRHEVLRDMGAEADRLYRLVEDLIVLARAERGESSVALEPVLLDRVVERVAAAFRDQSGSVELTIVQHGPTVAVQGDETYVEQLLRNLVSNAYKYGASGGVVEIEINHGGWRAGDPYGGSGGRESEVRVMDRGPGLNEEEIGRLFEIDYRSPVTTGLAQGSGIGLFVARWLAESMGGRIWARPREGGGSEFGFAMGAVDSDRATDIIDLGQIPGLTH